MSNQMQGMDTEQARQIAQQMGQHAGQVAGVVTRLSARVEATSWVGSDKAHLQQDMQQHFVPQANNAAQTVEEQARALTLHADRQDEVSA